MRCAPRSGDRNPSDEPDTRTRSRARPSTSGRTSELDHCSPPHVSGLRAGNRSLLARRFLYVKRSDDSSSSAGPEPTGRRQEVGQAPVGRTQRSRQGEGRVDAEVPTLVKAANRSAALGAEWRSSRRRWVVLADLPAAPNPSASRRPCRSKACPSSLSRSRELLRNFRRAPSRNGLPAEARFADVVGPPPPRLQWAAFACIHERRW